MCVIVVKPAGVDLPEAVVRRSFKAYSHGWGLATWGVQERAPGEPRRTAADLVPAWWHAHGMSEGSLLATVARDVRKDAPAVLHCRFASVGAVTLENTHPFRLPKCGGLLFHNGTMRIGSLADKRTDSEQMAEWLGQIENLPDLVTKGWWIDLLSDLVGSSRLALCTVDADGAPRITMVNEDLGERENGLWASNGAAFDKPRKIYTSGKGHYDPNGHYWSSNGGYYGDGVFGEAEEAYALEELRKNVKKGESSTTVLTSKSSNGHKPRRGKGKEQEKTVDASAEQEVSPIVPYVGRSLLTVPTGEDIAGTGDMEYAGSMVRANQAAESFEMCKDLQDMTRKVALSPTDAALALWYYRSMFEGSVV